MKVLRSSQPEVRNPVLALPAMKGVLAMEPYQRQVLAALLSDLSVDAAERAQHSWRKHKAPMALYWKAVGVYAKHLARAVRP